MKKHLCRLTAIAAMVLVTASSPAQAKNPVFDHLFTADPAAMVHGDTVYLFTGHDEAPNNDKFFEMHDWLLFSSKDMKTWQAHGAVLKATDFSWAKGDAWAAHAIERNGKFYFYTTVRHKDDKPGFAVGVAVADSPLGPFKDAIGKALITNEMTTQTKNDWDDIDPAAFIDDDGQAYLFFGNSVAKYVKLKANMTELDGEIKVIDLKDFTEALWLHKKDKTYYLSYACEFPEKICYASSNSIDGPWQYGGILNEIAGNSETNHQSIIEFKGQSYFIYHTGALPPKVGPNGAEASGGRFRRSVAIDLLHYKPDGSLKRVIMTSEGIR